MCSDPTSREAIAYFQDRFGVDPDALAFLCFRERGDDIWASSEAPPVDLRAPRMAGLRALRRTPHGLKPTSAFLACIGPHLTTSTVSLDLDPLRSLLLGRQLATNASDGFVAIVFADDVIGCGRAHSGQLSALIPTGRRRELLEALS